jgi:hypothetical protein
MKKNRLRYTMDCARDTVDTVITMTTTRWPVRYRFLYGIHMAHTIWPVMFSWWFFARSKCVHSPGEHPMTVWFYSLSTYTHTCTIITINVYDTEETRHVRGILSLCNLIDHVLLHSCRSSSHGLVIGCCYQNRSTSCTIRLGVHMRVVREPAHRRMVAWNLIEVFGDGAPPYCSFFIIINSNAEHYICVSCGMFQR